jgi:hypothetical protein
VDERSASRRRVKYAVLLASTLVVLLAVAMTAASMPHAVQVRTLATGPAGIPRRSLALAAPNTTLAPTTTAAPSTTVALTDASLASSSHATLHDAVATTVPHRTVATTPTTVRHVAAVAPVTAPPATAPPTTVAIPPSAAAVLACIRQRESGGNYAAVSANGVYRGAYQFSQATWDSSARHAGRPDLVGRPPNTVSPPDQDAVALDTYLWEGLAPWGGYCG